MEQNGIKLKVLPLLITPEQPPTPPTPSPANILQRGQNEVEVKLLLSSRTSERKAERGRAGPILDLAPGVNQAKSGQIEPEHGVSPLLTTPEELCAAEVG